MARLQDWLVSTADSTSGSLLVALLAAIGACEGLRALLRLLHGVYIYFLRPGRNLKKLGSWAVVTGATDGIGRAYTNVLAKKGLNTVLISRTESRLRTAADEIEAKYKVKTKVVVVDFSKADGATWDSIKAEIGELDIGVLVNNVGLSYDHAEYFDQIDDQLIDDLISINIQATNKMTRIVVPGMKSRKRGAIVNIGSAAATVAPSGPLYAVYAGTKAYVDMFSKSLDLEFKASGLSIHNQAPAYVATKMSKIRRPRLDAPSPAAWAAAAVRHIGYEPTQCPYWYHGAMWGIVASTPLTIVNAYLLDFHLTLRKAWLRKQQREAAKSKSS